MMRVKILQIYCVIISILNMDDFIKFTDCTNEKNCAGIIDNFDKHQ